ncbi:MAG: VCBS repeat-containing protein [bacterium]|nr:VCBS repeat-containing protein [bacterium]
MKIKQKLHFTIVSLTLLFFTQCYSDYNTCNDQIKGTISGPRSSISVEEDSPFGTLVLNRVKVENWNKENGFIEGPYGSFRYYIFPSDETAPPSHPDSQKTERSYFSDAAGYYFKGQSLHGPHKVPGENKWEWKADNINIADDGDDYTFPNPIPVYKWKSLDDEIIFYMYESDECTIIAGQTVCNDHDSLIYAKIKRSDLVNGQKMYNGFAYGTGTEIYVSTTNALTRLKGREIWETGKGWHDMNLQCNRYKKGDFNGDGKIDLAFIAGGTAYVWCADTEYGISLGGTSFTTSGLGYGDDMSKYAVGDFNGDTKSDLCFIDNGTIYVWTSTGSSFVGSEFQVAYGRGSGADLSKYKLGDFNGDGKTDICFVNGPNIYIWCTDTSGSNLNGPSCSKAIAFNPNYSLSGSNYFLGKADINSTTDIFIITPGTGNIIAYSSEIQNNQINLVHKYTRNEIQDYFLFLNQNIQMSQFRLGDINGDKKSDIFFFKGNGDIIIWPSNDSGLDFFKTFSGYGEPLNDFSRYKLADIDGDERVDLVYIGGERAFIWTNGSIDQNSINLSGTSYFTNPGFCSRDGQSVMLGDLNNDGGSDLFYFKHKHSGDNGRIHILLTNDLPIEGGGIFSYLSK